MEKNIGKNTIGDNNKMSVDLRTYNMSTHDLSTIVRNTQSPGTLVPNLCLVAQKGDILDIDIEANALTHPTVGPLFGSFKLEHHLYTIPFRLYNSWLHNNRAKIGLDMSQVKIPQIQATIKESDNPSSEDEFTQINPSCLLSYLGIKGYGTTDTNGVKAEKNGIPLLGYYDIFKNYYANQQEENFYIIGANNSVTKVISTRGWIANNPNNINEAVFTNDIVTIQPAGQSGSNIIVSVFDMATEKWLNGTLAEIGGTSSYTPATGVWKPNIPQTTGWLLMSVAFKNSITALKSYPLTQLDDIRDKIYYTPGNTTFVVTGDDAPSLFKGFQLRQPNGKLNTTLPQYGLAVKTYNSDLYQNWINSEWIDGVNGINEVSSVDVTDGKLSMDALNLAQKVYNFLNRIAVSGGMYRDWLDTVFTGGNYMERCETPIFEGGTSQEIVFQEVISNSSSGIEPLGTLAGRGITTKKQRGGHIKVKITEPCYVMCICSITPRIDYNQGNTWDATLKTMDDLHKPALDGIGYQDSLNDERAWWDRNVNLNGDIVTAAGKTVAWINYMTNVNRTYGNFALNDNEAFMVLNRNYSLTTNDDKKFNIEDLTTYIDPVKFNYIFSDTSIDAMNFWIQTRFDIKARRLISAKQIPNL